MKAGRYLQILLLLALACLPIPARSARLQNLSPSGLADGPGIWVNMWHYPDGDLDAYCSALRQNGIRNIFIQTSRSNTDAITHPEQLGQLIEACHRSNIRIIAWSFAELYDPAGDARKLVAAARFESQHGQRLDGIAGNMEKNLAKPLVEAYSLALRHDLGQNYPMIAVVYSPLNRAPAVAQIPWKVLAQYWDVIAPMTYWGGKYQKLDPYTYTVLTVQSVRKLTGKPDVEIHLIGDGMGTTGQELQQFLKACQSAEAASASLYPNHLPTPAQLANLGRYRDYFPSNARFRLAAFRELRAAGILSDPPKFDPSQPIAREEFYRLIARELFLKNPAQEISTAQALDMLSAAGVLPEASETSLSSPVASLEAISIIAASLESQTNAKTQPKTRLHRPASRWLMQPVSAAAIAPQKPELKFINYLDAAQIVLQARAGLR